MNAVPGRWPGAWDGAMTDTRRWGWTRAAWAAGLLLVAAGCAPEGGGYFEQAAEETGQAERFEQAPFDAGKADHPGASAPVVPDGADTEVWAVTEAWMDTDTPKARQAGLAWPADSGLTWEQKFDRWVASFERIEGESGYQDTFRITTPFGDRTLPAPQLECAEVAFMLRAAFASWYGLPFFVKGWDAQARQPVFAGHFGFVDPDGRRWRRFPRFKQAYRDYTSSWQPGDPWPRDERLRRLRLADDDENGFLGSGLGAGAYFDELLLNKRVGYFLRLLLLYFGSINLADPANMFDIRPEATGAGDVLLKRWQRRGIGHTVIVLRSEQPAPDRLALTVVSGSIPRRQPVWEENAYARSYFVSEQGGGQGENADGDRYVDLGGGIKRWYTPVRRGSRWELAVSADDADAFIPRSDKETLAARPARFEELLADVPPEERLRVLLDRIEMARQHLRRYPASCAARQRREDAFAELYAFAAEAFDKSPAEVDAEYRTLEDYVFARLQYDASRVCCWNSSTSDMYEIVMDYAQQEQQRAEEGGTCVQPTVFRAEAGSGDGFDRWRNHAASLGREAQWRPWSADEPCGGRDTGRDDPLTEEQPTAWCDLPADGGSGGGTMPPPPPPADMCDPSGDNDSRRGAPAVRSGDTVDEEICEDDSDWFYVDGTGALSVRIEFDHDVGDLDMRAYDVEGNQFDISNGVSDSEELRGQAPFYVRVYGYGGATGPYTLTVTP